MKYLGAFIFFVFLANIIAHFFVLIDDEPHDIGRCYVEIGLSAIAAFYIAGTIWA